MENFQLIFLHALKSLIHLIERVHRDIEFLFHFVQIDTACEKIQNSDHCFAPI